MAWGAIGAAAGGSALDIISGTINKGIDFGFANKARSQYASQVRHLRRREYQDMMFSMRKAGLNPMLASGATPGHSAAMMTDIGGGFDHGPSTAIAANRQAGAAEGQVDVGKRNARVKEVMAPYEVGNLVADRYLKAGQIERMALENRFTQQSTAESEARTKHALEQATSEAIHRMLMTKEAEREGFSARKIEAETEQIRKNYNIPPWNLMGSDAHKVGEDIGKYIHSSLDYLNQHSDELRGSK